MILISVSINNKKISNLSEEFPEEQSYFMKENSPGPAGIYLLGKIRVFQHRPQASVAFQTSGGLSRGVIHTKDTRTDFGLLSFFSCVLH